MRRPKTRACFTLSSLLIAVALACWFGSPDWLVPYTSTVVTVAGGLAAIVCVAALVLGRFETPIEVTVTKPLPSNVLWWKPPNRRMQRTRGTAASRLAGVVSAGR